MTLLSRLALLVTLAVAVAVGPVLYLTWRMGGETTVSYTHLRAHET